MRDATYQVFGDESAAQGGDQDDGLMTRQ